METGLKICKRPGMMVADRTSKVEPEPLARQHKKILSLSFFCRGGRGNGEAVAHQEGLLCKILSFLPLRKVHQLRLVCKSWDSLLTSPAFKQDWSRAHLGQEDGDDGETCWLVMVRRKPDDARAFARELIAFDTATGTWISLMPLLAACPPAVLSVLGGPTCRNVANPFPCDDYASFCNFMAVGTGAISAGLVCFLCSPVLSDNPRSDWDWMFAYELCDYSLLVLNLLTGSYNLIPPLPKHSDLLLSAWKSLLRISLQPLTSPHYRVFLQNPSFERFPGPLEIYDSQSSSWKVGRSCCSPKDAKMACAADLDRADLLQYMIVTHTVFAYNVDADEWCQVYAGHVELGTGPMGFFQHGKVLLRHRGRILLAGAQFKPYPATAMTGFSIWELQLRSPPHNAAAPGTQIADWVQVATTPPQYWEGMYEIHRDTHEIDVKLISSGSLICMTAVHYSNAYYRGTYYPPLVYDLVRDSWYHLPPYKGHKDFMASFCMQPSFVATA